MESENQFEKSFKGVKKLIVPIVKANPSISYSDEVLAVWKAQGLKMGTLLEFLKSLPLTHVEDYPEELHVIIKKGTVDVTGKGATLLLIPQDWLEKKLYSFETIRRATQKLREQKLIPEPSAEVKFQRVNHQADVEEFMHRTKGGVSE